MHAGHRKESHEKSEIALEVVLSGHAERFAVVFLDNQKLGREQNPLLHDHSSYARGRCGAVGGREGQIEREENMCRERRRR
jgi:hypothetical protein